MRQYLAALMGALIAALITGACFGPLNGSVAHAATDYPIRPIRLLVGFAPGGATDTLARLLTGALGTEVGQTIYVDNLAGASGYLAWKTVAGSAPDGHTLLLAENAIVIRPGFKDQTPPFDPVTQLDSIAAVAYSPLALCVSNRVPAANVRELIELSRSAPKKLDYASAGVGSVAQLVWEAVKDGAGIEAVDVPYRGGGPAMTDIVAGQVDIVMAATSVAKPYVDSKLIKCFAVTGRTRSPALPQLPTLEEAGIKHADVDLRFWFGLLGPKGLPEDVKTKLEKAIEHAIGSPTLRERLDALDIAPDFAPGATLQARLVSEIKNWKEFIEAKGITWH
jgi:tripartite-type tricarboxylate transporter receptor subunit TctC